MATLTRPVAFPASETASGAERRRAVRNRHLSTGWLSNECGNLKSQQQHVSVFDLSLGGVGFTCDKPLDVDAIHWIVVNGGALNVSSRVRISYCRRNENKYDCGGEFF